MVWYVVASWVFQWRVGSQVDGDNMQGLLRWVECFKDQQITGLIVIIKINLQPITSNPMAHETSIWNSRYPLWFWACGCANRDGVEASKLLIWLYHVGENINLKYHAHKIIKTITYMLWRLLIHRTFEFHEKTWHRRTFQKTYTRTDSLQSTTPQ